jgi:hypothetical protein
VFPLKVAEPPPLAPLPTGLEAALPSPAPPPVDNAKIPKLELPPAFPGVLELPSPVTVIAAPPAPTVTLTVEGKSPILIESKETPPPPPPVAIREPPLLCREAPPLPPPPIHATISVSFASAVGFVQVPDVVKV